MPNHITNVVKFVAPAERAAEVRAAIKGAEEVFDFNSLITMPQGLRNFSPCSTTICIAKAAEGVGTPFDVQIAERDRNSPHISAAGVARCRENIRLYGFAYWYDWAIDAWGTQWGAYNQSEDGPDTIRFDTTWSCPRRVFDILAARYPDVEIVVEYADEDIGHNCGRLTYRDGALVEAWAPEGEEARAFAYEVKGWDPDED